MEVTNIEYICVGRKIHETHDRCTFEARRSCRATQKFALKQIKVAAEDQAQVVLSEVDLWIKLKHPRILCFLTSWVGGEIETGEGGVRILELPQGAVPGKTGPRARLIPEAPLEAFRSLWGLGTSVKVYLYILMELSVLTLWTGLSLPQGGAGGSGGGGGGTNVGVGRSNRMSFSSWMDNVDDSARWRWTIQLAEGLKYLHHHAGVVHRNLSPYSVYLKAGQLQIGDFQLAMRLHLDERAIGHNTPGAPPLDAHLCQWGLYSAPELGDETYGYDCKVDIYSWALVVVLIWLNSDSGFKRWLPEFKTLEDVEVLLSDIRECGHPPTGWAPRHPRLAGLVARALDLDPDKRPTADELLRDLRFTQVLWSDARYKKAAPYVAGPASYEGMQAFPPRVASPNRYGSSLGTSGHLIAGLGDIREDQMFLDHRGVEEVYHKGQYVVPWTAPHSIRNISTSSKSVDWGAGSLPPPTPLNTLIKDEDSKTKLPPLRVRIKHDQ